MGGGGVMANGWQTVPLGEFLTQCKEFFTIDDFTRYKRARVQSHGKGIVLRDEVTGAEIKTKKQQAARTGEFLVAEIDAKVGGFGIVPPELDGAVVSSHYFLFQIDENKCSQDWLNWFVRYNSLEEQTKAQGSTNYAAIRPNDVLNFEIPLPPLTEQRRIVARIEALATRITAIQSLRREIETDLERMLLSAYHSIADNAERKPMEDVAPLCRRPANVNPDENYPQVSVRSFGRGSFHRPNLDGNEITWQKPYLVKEGDILISNIKAWEGAIAVASDEDDGRYGSHRYLTCVAKPNIATSRFVCFHLLTPKGLFDVGQASPGSADRNRTLGAKALMQISIPVPPIEKQLRFDKLYAKVSALRAVQAETEKELSALMPSVLDRAFKGEL
jgi:type I restriction enzyme S subunit